MAETREELEKRLAELEEREFTLNMKDSWDNSDSRTMSQIIAEEKEIERKLNEIQP